MTSASPRPAERSIPTVTLAAALAHLLEELAPWRQELPADIRHAHDRGLPHLEADLRRLHDRVETAWKAARAVAHPHA